MLTRAADTATPRYVQGLTDCRSSRAAPRGTTAAAAASAAAAMDDVPVVRWAGACGLRSRCRFSSRRLGSGVPLVASPNPLRTLLRSGGRVCRPSSRRAIGGQEQNSGASGAKVASTTEPSVLSGEVQRAQVGATGGRGDEEVEQGPVVPKIEAPLRLPVEQVLAQPRDGGSGPNPSACLRRERRPGHIEHRQIDKAALEQIVEQRTEVPAPTSRTAASFPRYPVCRSAPATGVACPDTSSGYWFSAERVFDGIRVADSFLDGFHCCFAMMRRLRSFPGERPLARLPATRERVEDVEQHAQSHHAGKPGETARCSGRAGVKGEPADPPEPLLAAYPPNRRDLLSRKLHTDRHPAGVTAEQYPILLD